MCGDMHHTRPQPTTCTWFAAGFAEGMPIIIEYPSHWLYNTCVVQLRSNFFHSIGRLVADEQRDTADLWLLNTCTVKGPSQAAMSTLVAAGKKRGKALLVAGCVPQGAAPRRVDEKLKLEDGETGSYTGQLPSLT